MKTEYYNSFEVHIIMILVSGAQCYHPALPLVCWNGKALQYSDIADQFVVLWLGIAAVMVDVKHCKTATKLGPKRKFHQFQ